MIIKKLVFLFSILSLFIFFTAIILGIHWGVFSPVQIYTSHREKMYFITTKNTTYYPYVHTQFDSVKDYLSYYKRKLIDNSIIIWDDPTFSPLNEIQVSGGFYHHDSFVIEDSRFRIVTIDSGMVIVGILKAHPQITPYKLYPALTEWLYNNNYKYDSSRVIIQTLKTGGETEVHFPIHSP